MSEAGKIGMKRMVVALCVDIPELNNNGFKDSLIARKYPGSLWATHFRQYPDLEVVSGDVALRMHEEGERAPDEIYIVREQNAIHALQLEKLGCNRALLTCFESPLFAARFYLDLPELKQRYKAHLLFNDPMNPLRFPSFATVDLDRRRKPWAERMDRVVAVLSNKHYRMSTHWLPAEEQSYIGSLHQLHDARYKALEELAILGQLALYGDGWTEAYLRAIPGAIFRYPALFEYVREHHPHPIENKISVLEEFRYALCFENLDHPGYLTEKLFDCLVAQTVPIFRGCVEDIPRDIYVDGNSWGGYKEMSERTSDNAQRMIVAGQEFLRTTGRGYTYEAVAKQVFDILSAQASTA